MIIKLNKFLLLLLKFQIVTVKPLQVMKKEKITVAVKAAYKAIRISKVNPKMKLKDLLKQRVLNQMILGM